MRGIVFVIISCFLFSNIANAAMFCCVDLTPHDNSAEMPPCHDKIDSELQSQSADTGAEQGCDCDNCAQKNNLQSLVFDTTLVPDEACSPYLRTPVNPELSPIYLPPKRNT
jgi:hypothetical protein